MALYKYIIIIIKQDENLPSNKLYSHDIPMRTYTVSQWVWDGETGELWADITAKRKTPSATTKTDSLDRNCLSSVAVVPGRSKVIIGHVWKSFLWSRLTRHYISFVRLHVYRYRNSRVERIPIFFRVADDRLSVETDSDCLSAYLILISANQLTHTRMDSEKIVYFSNWAQFEKYKLLLPRNPCACELVGVYKVR